MSKQRVCLTFELGYRAECALESADLAGARSGDGEGRRNRAEVVKTSSRRLVERFEVTGAENSALPHGPKSHRAQDHMETHPTPL